MRGFYDPRTGPTVLIAGNVALRPGEPPQAALTRVMLHERVGHDGLNAMLSGPPLPDGRPGIIQQRWANLQKGMPQAELDAIAAEPGYAHLKGNREALALEWFARQAEARPELLTQPSLVQKMWGNFKDSVVDLMARMGLEPPQGKDLDTQVMALLQRARQSAVKGGSGPNAGSGALGQDLQFSMGQEPTVTGEPKGGAVPTSPAKPPSITDGSDVPPIRDGENIVQSSKYWYIFEHKGKKYVRFFAPEARSPNGAKKGGRGDGGGDNGSALLTPEGRIYVEEGQHRLNGVVLEGNTNMSSVPGHPQWLEFEFNGNTEIPGEPPAYSEGESWINVNKENPWDGEEGY